jgi:hypothetical protein
MVGSPGTAAMIAHLLPFSSERVSVRGFATAAFVAFGAAAAVHAAAAELILSDGRVVGGSDARRDGDDWVVTLEGGEAIVIPAALVEVVRSGEPEEEGREPVRPAPEPPAEDRDGGAPSGWRTPEAETLAGAPLRSPGSAEQLEVFGAAARFPSSIIEPEWKPSSDWDMDSDRRNNFNPARWVEDPVEHDWVPVSAFDAAKDVLAGSRSRWPKSIVEPAWTPADGFSSTGAGRDF